MARAERRKGSMNPRTEAAPRIVRIARAHKRLSISALAGLVSFAVLAVLPGGPGGVTCVLIGWDVGVACYLVWAAVMMARSPVAEIRRHAAAQDEGAFAILLLTVAAAVASLGAIFVELAWVAPSSAAHRWYVALAIATVVLSWAFTHTIFALHYAYEFYGEGERAKGLKFPNDDRPDYWDFIYFAFVIGMTFQVSDVGVTHKAIRRMVVAHGVLSFVFSTAILALTVNIVSGWISNR
jgi:uncharacterized membrane protein